MRKVAFLLSYVFHPLWTPLLLLGVLWGVDPWIRMHPSVMMYVATVLLINALAPAVSIWFLYKRGALGDLEVSNRKERKWPFLMVLFYQVLGYIALTRPGVYLPPEVLGLVLAMMASLVLAIFVNRRIKMSMHLLANGGAIGGIWAFNQLHTLGLEPVLPLGFLLAGAIGWSRMKLGVHTPKELALGFLVGFTIVRAVVESGWAL
jgi:membrane-associated phospholipid phosphatase